MPKTGALILLTGFLLIAAAMSASAQSYNAAQTFGITDVSSVLNGNTFTWTLTNNSDQSDPAWDVLVWSLVPYNVREAVSVTAPAGWSWTGSGWAQWNVQANQKYFTPPAIGPGESAVFTYTFDPSGPMINSAPGEGMVFLTHVGAVAPGSGDSLGTDRWTEGLTTVFAGSGTWFDASTPEPGSLLALGAGLVSLFGLRKKQQSS